MRSSSMLSTIALFLSTASIAAASGVYHLIHDSVVLVQRQNGACATPCGYYNQLCCTSGQTCITNALGQAECAGAQQGGGYWSYITQTTVMTDLVTQTIVVSTFIGGAVPTAVAGAPCGGGVCAAGQYCLNNERGICAAAGGTTGVPAGPAPTTLQVSPTTTVPIRSATPAGSTTGQGAADMEDGGGGLSGGAIAGIVIGVLAGIALLILLCLFCCAKTLFDSILAIFGFGKKRRRTEETYIHEHHSHSGHGGGAGGWYGRPARPQKEEKKSGLGGIGKIGAGLGALALVLGLKRRHDRKNDEKSDYSSRSSDYYSDYTSSSSASSSDRRTRQTRQSSRR